MVEGRVYPAGRTRRSLQGQRVTRAHLLVTRAGPGVTRELRTAVRGRFRGAGRADAVTSGGCEEGETGVSGPTATEPQARARLAGAGPWTRAGRARAGSVWREMWRTRLAKRPVPPQVMVKVVHPVDGDGARVPTSPLVSCRGAASACRKPQNDSPQSDPKPCDFMRQLRTATTSPSMSDLGRPGCVCRKIDTL